MLQACTLLDFPDQPSLLPWAQPPVWGAPWYRKATGTHDSQYSPSTDRFPTRLKGAQASCPRALHGVGASSQQQALAARMAGSRKLERGPHPA